MIINTGGRDVVIDKISIRGQECPWSKVCYNITTGSFTPDLAYNSSTTVGTGDISLGGTDYAFNATADDLTLKSGYTILIYIDDPDSISINDVGLTVSIAIYTANAVHYREANVEAVTM